MKTVASTNTPLFFNSTLSMTGTWGTTRQHIRRLPRAVQPLALHDDDRTAAKQEIVCGGILALTFLYTLAHCFIQLAP